MPTGTASSIEAYLDSRRGFVPLQIIHFANGKLSAKLNITYDEARGGLWVPEAWKSEMYSPTGRISERTENRLLSVIKPVRIGDDEFRIRFPAGTVVYDKRKNEEPFVVQNDGSMIPLKLASQQPPARSWIIWASLLISALVVAVATIWFIWRRAAAKGRASE